MTGPLFSHEPRGEYTPLHAMQGAAFDGAGLTQSALGAVPARHRLKVIGALLIFGAGTVFGCMLDNASPPVGDGRDVTPGQYEYQPAAPSVTAVPAVPPTWGVGQ